MESPLFPFPVGSLPLFIQPRIVSLTTTARAVHGLTILGHRQAVSICSIETIPVRLVGHAIGLEAEKSAITLGTYDLDRHTVEEWPKRVVLCSAHAFFGNSPLHG